MLVPVYPLTQIRLISPRMHCLYERSRVEFDLRTVARLKSPPRRIVVETYILLCPSHHVAALLLDRVELATTTMAIQMLP